MRNRKKKKETLENSNTSIISVPKADSLFDIDKGTVNSGDTSIIDKVNYNSREEGNFDEYKKYQLRGCSSALRLGKHLLFNSF